MKNHQVENLTNDILNEFKSLLLSNHAAISLFTSVEAESLLINNYLSVFLSLSIESRTKITEAALEYWLYFNKVGFTTTVVPISNKLELLTNKLDSIESDTDYLKQCIIGPSIPHFPPFEQANEARLLSQLSPFYTAYQFNKFKGIGEHLLDQDVSPFGTIAPPHISKVDEIFMYYKQEEKFTPEGAFDQLLKYLKKQYPDYDVLSLYNIDPQDYIKWNNQVNQRRSRKHN